MEPSEYLPPDEYWEDGDDVNKEVWLEDLLEELNRDLSSECPECGGKIENGVCQSMQCKQRLI